MTIHWKAVEQYFTVMLFVVRCSPVCNFGKFDNSGFGIIRVGGGGGGGGEDNRPWLVLSTGIRTRFSFPSEFGGPNSLGHQQSTSCSHFFHYCWETSFNKHKFKHKSLKQDFTACNAKFSLNIVLVIYSRMILAAWKAPFFLIVYCLKVGISSLQYLQISYPIYR